MTTTSHVGPRTGRTAADIARTSVGRRQIPALIPTRARRRPASSQVVADSGLQITTVRMATTPMVHLRLRIPFGGSSPTHAARAELLAETMLLGTATRDRMQIDTELAAVGGSLTAHVSPQSLKLVGSVLAPGLPVLLDMLADVLTSATYPLAEVRRERDRLVEHLLLASAQPSTIAREKLQQRRFGNHPAAREVPQGEAVARVAPGSLRTLHRTAVVPRGSSLIVVGDVQPERVAEQLAEGLSDWSGDAAAQELSSPPPVLPGPILLHHRDGAVQSQTRLTSQGVLRADPSYAAAQLANIVFGGYFSSRLVENLREDKGFTYHAHTALEFWPGRGALTLSYDTATDVAAAALVETRHELGRIALVAPTEDEIESARQYAIGSLSSSLAMQAGYANMLSALSAASLGADWLTEHTRRLRKATASEIADAAARLFAPSAFTGVVVGDLTTSRQDFARLDGVQES